MTRTDRRRTTQDGKAGEESLSPRHSRPSLRGKQRALRFLLCHGLTQTDTDGHGEDLTPRPRSCPSGMLWKLLIYLGGRIFTLLSGRRHSGDRCTMRIPCSQGSGVFDGGGNIRDKRPSQRVFSQNRCRPDGQRPFVLKSSWSLCSFWVLSNLGGIFGPSFPVSMSLRHHRRPSPDQESGKGRECSGNNVRLSIRNINKF